MAYNVYDHAFPAVPDESAGTFDTREDAAEKAAELAKEHEAQGWTMIRRDDDWLGVKDGEQVLVYVLNDEPRPRRPWTSSNPRPTAANVHPGFRR